MYAVHVVHRVCLLNLVKIAPGITVKTLRTIKCLLVDMPAIWLLIDLAVKWFDMV